MKGFGLAPVKPQGKQEGRCVDYQSGVMFNHYPDEFNKFYNENHVKWYHKYLPKNIKRTSKSRIRRVWEKALLHKAKMGDKLI